MPTFVAQPLDVSGTLAFFAEYEGLDHLRVRKHGALLIIESGPNDDPLRHARLRRVSAQWWTLEIATHTGKWQKVPLRAPRNDILRALVEDFGWMLQPLA